jgi:hypothetical protein
MVSGLMQTLPTRMRPASSKANAARHTSDGDRPSSTLLLTLSQGAGMNLTDATLALLLAAKIHGTDEAIRKTAKSVVKQLPRSRRDLIFIIIESRQPLELVKHLGVNLEP